jgi:hypothetical protein
MIDEVDESLELTPPGGSGKKAAGAGGNSGTGNNSEDLSQDLARTLTRAVMEQVTCRRVGDHHYRCNWWTPQATAAYDNPSMLGSLVTTSRISKSQFIEATKSGGKLTVKVITR